MSYVPRSLKEVNLELTSVSIEFAGEHDTARLERLGRELSGLRRMANWLRAQQRQEAA